ncbi:uncharacterized protein LOC130801684 isoform X1 [Amaranthus tricolor]|uniref:uncharacterized protein LOC130801684 isoform X1 n=2 Tax=Amaranthus tricolor TaxID=29722 RepID=UPI0025902266|nr:uncharacterized protein LOC130801684 isoform X1 [Amaranthus tricolor]
MDALWAVGVSTQMSCLNIKLAEFQGISMTSKHTNKEEIRNYIKKKPENWKFRKIPVDQVYKTNILHKIPSYIIKDFEETVKINSSNNKNVSLNLLSTKFLNGFIKKHHLFLHLGLVQIAIKPLITDGLGAPIVVCIRDVRHHNFQKSLLALVESDLCKGPFYFNCFPSFSVSLDDVSSLQVLIMARGIPLEFTYRIVCKAMVDLSSEALNEPVLGETTYFQLATGVSCTTKWDEFDLHISESSTANEVPEQQSRDSVDSRPDDRVLNEGTLMAEGSSTINRNLDEWKYPKIPVDQVYNSDNHAILNLGSIFGHSSAWSKAKKALNILPSSSVKDIEKTITLKANQSICIKLLKGCISKQDKLMDLGLVQIAIKPLIIDGLKAPIIVCLRDARLLDIKRSLKEVVQTDLSQGPFYINNIPGHSISLSDDSLSAVLTLNVSKCRVPLKLTYRVVCKVSKYPILVQRGEKWTPGETTYFQPGIGTRNTTKWDEVQIPESWAHT